MSNRRSVLKSCNEESDLLDDVEEEAKFAPARKMTIEVPKEDVVDIGDRYFKAAELHLFFKKLQSDLSPENVTVPILGTYHNCYPGDSITLWLMANHANARHEKEAVAIGQELVDMGYLRQIGSVSSRFVNDPSQHYQFKKKALALDPEASMMMSPSSTISSSALTANSTIVAAEKLPMIGSFVSQYTNPNNETYPRRLRRDADLADEAYKTAVKKADRNRLFLEEALVDHLKFTEKCEYNRLRALKAVFLSISASIGNVLPTIQGSCDRCLLHQETYNPDGDLRALIDQYRTGAFTPNVPVYENYYRQDTAQTFGIALEQKTRQRARKVPQVVDALLNRLSDGYLKIESKEEKQNTWIYEVPLSAVHHCREAINDGNDVSAATLEAYDLPIVCSTLKLYLQELPVPILQFSLWDPLKKLYTKNIDTEEDEGDEGERITILSKTLQTLSPPHFVTLDTVAGHLSDLIKETEADDDYIITLGNVMGPCLLRPKAVNQVTLHDRFAQRVARDIIKHYDQMFDSIKASGIFRMSTITGKSSAQASQRNSIVEENAPKLPPIDTAVTNVAHEKPATHAPVRLVDREMSLDDVDITPVATKSSVQLTDRMVEAEPASESPIATIADNVQAKIAEPVAQPKPEPVVERTMAPPPVTNIKRESHPPITSRRELAPSDDALPKRSSWRDQQYGTPTTTSDLAPPQVPRRPNSPQYAVDSTGHKRPIGVSLTDNPAPSDAEKKSSLSRRQGGIHRSSGVVRNKSGGGSGESARPLSTGGGVAARIRNLESQGQE